MDCQIWVAIIDDDAAVRRSLSRVLLCAGIPVATFDSAEKYLERAGLGDPGCILLDVDLGSGLTGFELKERLEAAGAAPPIILMTGQAEIPLPEPGEHGEPVGLRKPFAAERLIDCVRRHLQPAVIPTPS
jgi:FixJ family two-component response regulator